jgi:hypothetical protein
MITTSARFFQNRETRGTSSQPCPWASVPGRLRSDFAKVGDQASAVGAKRSHGLAGKKLGRVMFARASPTIVSSDVVALPDTPKPPEFLGYGTDLANPDFAAMAQAMCIRGIRLTNPAEVEDGIASALAHNRPVLVDAVRKPGRTRDAPFDHRRNG